jgi:hypothetical protein
MAQFYQSAAASVFSKSSQEDDRGKAKLRMEKFATAYCVASASYANNSTLMDDSGHVDQAIESLAHAGLRSAREPDFLPAFMRGYDTSIFSWATSKALLHDFRRSAEAVGYFKARITDTGTIALSDLAGAPFIDAIAEHGADVGFNLTAAGHTQSTAAAQVRFTSQQAIIAWCITVRGTTTRILAERYRSLHAELVDSPKLTSHPAVAMWECIYPRMMSAASHVGGKTGERLHRAWTALVTVLLYRGTAYLGTQSDLAGGAFAHPSSSVAAGLPNQFHMDLANYAGAGGTDSFLPRTTASPARPSPRVPTPAYSSSAASGGAGGAGGAGNSYTASPSKLSSVADVFYALATTGFKGAWSIRNHDKPLGNHCWMCGPEGGHEVIKCPYAVPQVWSLFRPLRGLRTKPQHKYQKVGESLDDWFKDLGVPALDAARATQLAQPQLEGAGPATA